MAPITYPSPHQTPGPQARIPFQHLQNLVTGNRRDLHRVQPRLKEPGGRPWCRSRKVRPSAGGPADPLDGPFGPHEAWEIASRRVPYATPAGIVGCMAQGQCPHGAWGIPPWSFGAASTRRRCSSSTSRLVLPPGSLGRWPRIRLTGFPRDFMPQAEPATVKAWQSRARSRRMALAPKPSACRLRMSVAMSEPLVDARERRAGEVLTITRADCLAPLCWRLLGGG